MIILYNCVELLYANITVDFIEMLKEKKRENTVPKNETKKNKRKHDGTEHKIALCMRRFVLLRYYATTCNGRVNY